MEGVVYGSIRKSIPSFFYCVKLACEKMYITYLVTRKSQECNLHIRVSLTCLGITQNQVLLFRRSVRVQKSRYLSRDKARSSIFTWKGNWNCNDIVTDAFGLAKWDRGWNFRIQNSIFKKLMKSMTHTRLTWMLRLWVNNFWVSIREFLLGTEIFYIRAMYENFLHWKALYTVSVVTK